MNLQKYIAWILDLGRPYPTRDWGIVLALTLIVFLGGTSMASYRFWTIQTGSIVAAAADTPRAPTPVSRDLMKKVIEEYQQRAANYSARNFLTFTLNDPFIPARKK